MNTESTGSSLDTLHEIRDLMARSARFLSLSGWSGVWAGGVALIGAAIARHWLKGAAGVVMYSERMEQPDTIEYVFQFLILAMAVFILALAGGYFFTMRKNQKLGVKMWNSASRKLVWSLAIPLLAGGVCVLAFLWNAHYIYVAPACLVFYGLALINGSKYTVSDIRYLGLLEVLLGAIGMFFWGWGLVLWALGFGVLHILYGIIMWRKYDRG